MPPSTSNPKNLPWAWIKAVQHTLHSTPTPTIEQQQQQQQQLPIQLLPWLFLSDEAHVRQTTPLRQLGITHVLTTNGMPQHHLRELQNALQSVNVKHGYVNGQDEEGYPMLEQHWDACHAFLQQVKEEEDEEDDKKHGKVVVHCAAGMNRSGLVAAAAIMVMEKWTLMDVVRHLQEKRGLVLRNRSFQVQLCELAAREGLLGEKPEGFSDEPMDMMSRPPTMRRITKSLDLLANMG